ncbi:putative benzoate 4-monooxygenase cytochrome P450 [Cadophora sp. DSE1049]|nr:putative benzoate 4-monooxygenase cytochrome P450 [Cadophora sp. DSE1049]
MALSSLTPESLITTSLLLTATLLILAALVTLFIYRTTFSPLSHIPGPLLWRASRLPFAYNLFLGRLPYRLSTLHEEYGPIVRVAPNEVSFTTVDAWNDIYSVRKRENGVKVQMRKDPFMLLSPMEGTRDMIFELDDAEHARHRRIFSHAFSEKSLRDQEPIIAQHINRMSARLHEVNSKPVDMSAWFNYLLFDTIGDLVLGEALGCLETGTLHPWANTFFKFAKGITLMGMVERFWPLAPILMSFIPKSMQDAEAQHRDFTRDKLTNRLAKSSPRKDLISVISPFLSASGPNNLSLTELHNNTSVIVVAGSETTATALTGLTYYLLSNPPTLTRLKSEIRSTFTNAKDITMDSTRSLPYLTAVISESLRIFGPVPGQLRRIVPQGGCVISGVSVPGGTIVAVDGYSASHSAENFVAPKEFVPERWLSDSELRALSMSRSINEITAPKDFSNDHKKVVQPFSFGPRNCIGQRLAVAEMRLVVARLVWEFDFKIEEECKNWVEGMKVYTLYERPPLMCRVKPVEVRE